MADLGLKVLWPTEEADGNDGIKVDIVFVHGLRGGRDSTWKKKDWPVLWPKDILPKDIDCARIMTWGYDANVLNFFDSAGQTSIFGHAMQLLSDLAGKRRGVADRPIIFLAHSLGGLIVKDALYQSHSEGIQETVHRPRLAAIKTATIGVIFASTPHRGADKARWASIATNLSKAILKDPNDLLIQALKRGSETLERLQSDFSRILANLPVYTFSEELDFPGLNSKIVDKASCIIGFPHETQQDIPADHTMMVKFKNADEIGYVRIKDAMLDLIEDWDTKKTSTTSIRAPTAEEVRHTRVQKFVTYSGIVNAENVVQGDQEGQNVTMTLGSGRGSRS